MPNPLDRIRDLRAVVSEHAVDPQAEIYVIVCDGCGATVSAQSPEALIEAAAPWALAGVLGGTDLCPGCTAY